MIRKVIGVSFLIAFLLGCSADGLAQKLHPKLKKKETSLKTFLLVPPKVTITKGTVKGGEMMLKESEDIEKATQKLVLDTLKAKGFTVMESDAPADSANPNEETRYAMADLQGKYDQLYPQVQRKMKDVEKGRFTLGEDVAKIRPPSPVDALIFVRGSGNVLTAGKAILGALAGGQAGSMLYLSFGIIDAQTGEVLYFDQRQVASAAKGVGMFGQKSFHEQPEEVLKKPIDKAFQKVPVPAPTSAPSTK